VNNNKHKKDVLEYLSTSNNLSNQRTKNKQANKEKQLD